MIDIRDLGAKGDGIADDTAAIQLAIDSAKEILIPFGTYLISNSLTLKSDITIMGNGTLKVNSDGVAFAGIKALTSGTSGIQNVQIIGITIDGGGQVGGSITAGKRAAIGIYLTNCTNILIDRVHIKNCGVVNGAAPQSDATYGGFGILAQCNSGPIKNIKITSCTIEKIAGGGTNTGDGIDISGYSTTGITPEDILISNCTISIVGRHGIALAGTAGAGTSLCQNVRVTNSYISYTMLSGIDMEDATDIIISNSQFSNCGNFTTGGYYTYPGSFPITYRLRAAIATGIDSNNITTVDTIIENSNYGITFGAKLHKIRNVYINNSNTSDLNQGLSGGTGSLLIIDSQFNTVLECFNYLSTTATEVKIVNCSFAGLVKILELHGGIFTNCTFKAGTALQNPGSENITWEGCDFSSVLGTGIGIDVSFSNSRNIKNCIISNCRFYNLATGIVASDRNIIAWQITRCIFMSITTYGIRHNNAAGKMAFKNISGNQFINNTTATSIGISIIQANPAISIFQNYFEFIATCISITNISSSLDLLDVIVSNNLTINCTNGIFIILSTGLWNRCILTNNNIFGCSGTKLSLPGSGNAAGFVSNNIV